MTDQPPVEYGQPSESKLSRFSQARKLRDILQRRHSEKDKRPTYVDLGQIQVIGVNHTADTTKQRRETKKFISLLQSSENLLIEGSEDLFRWVPLEGHSYEFTALKYFTNAGKKDRIFYLEDQKRVYETIEKHGLDRTRRFFYAHVPNIWQHILRASSPEEANKNLEEMIDFIIFGTKAPLDREQLRRSMQNVYEALMDKQSQGQLVESTALVHSGTSHFEARIRDAEITLPRIHSLLKHIKGKAAVIVGNNHVPHLVASLRDNQPVAVQNWNQFLESQNQSFIAAVKVFDDVIFRK